MLGLIGRPRGPEGDSIKAGSGLWRPGKSRRGPQRGGTVGVSGLAVLALCAAGLQYVA
jgi:hypothetical protein